jgi:VWFA-related protein
MRRLSEAGGLALPESAAEGFFMRRSLGVAWMFLCVLLLDVAASRAQDVPQQVPAPGAVVQSENKQNSAELAARDEPATFKVNVKLVVVRAVVRDSQGHAVGNLHQDDFQIFDKGKPQTITQFDVEQPGLLTAKARETAEDNSSDLPASEPASYSLSTSTNKTVAVMPERFVAYLFDDVHLEFGDLARVREAAERHFSTLRPTDRAAFFTTSGQGNLDYTDDRAKLRDALLRLQPRPISSSSFKHDCPDISYYQADLIVNKNDMEATQVAMQQALNCEPLKMVPPGQQTVPLGNSSAMVTAVSTAVLSGGEHESRISLEGLKSVVRSVSRMPGQRSVVLVSPGFIVPDLEYEYYEIVDRALRAQVMINTLDARGLYVVMPFGDASTQPASPMGSDHTPPPGKTLIDIAAASAQDDLLASLAENTGGIFFHNNNDLDEGFRRVAQAPEYSYVLAFTPQNLKLDGSFHNLKVTLKSGQKLTLQARRGYYAPKHLADPSEQAKQEIEDEMFSQEELHNLPVKLRTQFFKASDDDAKLVVLAHVDVQHLRFRKVEGRNDNVLTCVSALFNRNGNFIQGMQKTVTMHWKDETLEHRLGSGITLKTSFDVKPGSYLVRLVVRDEQGQLMSAENGTVEIR